MNTNPQELDLYAEHVKENIKHQVASLRKANGLSMHDVAKALNMNENTYRIWEDPKRSCPRPSDIVKLSKLYGVSVDFLMSNIDSPEDVKQVAAPDGYNEDSSNPYLSEIDKYEKLLLLNVRQLTLSQKEELAQYIHGLLYNKEN